MFRLTKQRAASRANSGKSTGPRTTAGKAVSRFNALKQAAAYHEHHNSADSGQRLLVGTLVHNEWRRRRMRRVEAVLWQPSPMLCRRSLHLERHRPANPTFHNRFREFGFVPPKSNPRTRTRRTSRPPRMPRQVLSAAPRLCVEDNLPCQNMNCPFSDAHRDEIATGASE